MSDSKLLPKTKEEIMMATLGPGSEKPCVECQHNISTHTFEGVGRHDHAPCAFCGEGEASKFVRNGTGGVGCRT